MDMRCKDAALKDMALFLVEPHRRVATKQTHGGFLRCGGFFERRTAVRLNVEGWEYMRDGFL
jgi:hypothetical protein